MASPFDTPTVILFDEHQKFHSFGYEAEEAYSKLALNNKHHKWYFFKCFKMILHENKIKTEDVKEKKMLASEVFRGAIEYLKDHLLNSLSGAKMENIEILDKMKGSDVDKLDIASPGTKFMVINLDDDTSDTTVYERRDNGGLRELHRASLGELGSTKVNEDFFSMIIKIFGGPVFTKFINEHLEEYLAMQKELEAKIHKVTPSREISVRIPCALLQTYESECDENIMKAINGSPYAGKITMIRDVMRIDAQAFKNFFKPCSDKILINIKNLLKNPDVQGTNIFYMVGKFSESEMIQNAITTALSTGKCYHSGFTKSCSIARGCYIWTSSNSYYVKQV
ncbi:hypothetical protein ACF0H5_010706 [Mactra antiquata]